MRREWAFLAASIAALHHSSHADERVLDPGQVQLELALNAAFAGGGSYPGDAAGLRTALGVGVGARSDVAARAEWSLDHPDGDYRTLGAVFVDVRHVFEEHLAVHASVGRGWPGVQGRGPLPVPAYGPNDETKDLHWLVSVGAELRFAIAPNMYLAGGLTLESHPWDYFTDDCCAPAESVRFPFSLVSLSPTVDLVITATWSSTPDEYSLAASLAFHVERRLDLGVELGTQLHPDGYAYPAENHSVVGVFLRARSR